MAGLKKKHPLVKEEKAPKEKSAKKADKKKQAGKSISGWGFQPAFVGLLMVIAVAVAIEFLFVRNLETTIQTNNVQQFAKLVQHDLNSLSKVRGAAANSLISNSSLQAELDSNPELSLQMLKASSSDLVGVYSIAASRLNFVRNEFPGLGYASIDALRKAGKKPVIDAYVDGNKWFYQVAVATEGAGALKLLMIYDVSQLRSVLASHASSLNANLAVYTGSQANAGLVMQVGDVPSGAVVTLPLNFANWELRFALKPEAALSADRTLFWAISGAASLVALILIYILCFLYVKKVKADVVLASSLVQSGLNGQRKSTDRLVFAETKEMVTHVNQKQKTSEEKDLASAKQITTADTAAASKSMELQEAPAADEDDLNFDDLDLDEELGLSDELTADEPVSAQPVAGIAVDGSIFRAYDIRGIVDESLTEQTVEAIGRAFASEALAQGQSTICVGYDGRLSSPGYCEAICRGITSAGADAIVVGRVPTPVLYFATHQLQTGTGIMITGSHNPSNYNGFKMMIAGNTLAGDDIQALYQRIVSGDLATGDGVRSDQSVDEEYVDTIVNDVAVAAPLKVVLDAGNGVAGELAPRLVEELGCEVIPLFCEIDGNFPNHHPDPGKPKNLQDLIKAVEEHDADVGLAFDGDGDRVGVVTNSGKIIWPDRLLMLFAKDVVSRNPGADIIYDVKCSRHLNSLISGYGGRPIMWKTGHSLIKAKMKETGALLAGEMSGHVFFKERWYGFDDGLYSAVRLLEILGIEGRSADEVFEDFPEDVSTPEINVAVSEESKFQIVEKLCGLKAAFVDANVSTIDGLRADYADGWGLCRASNTTPVLVLRFEADDEDALERIKAQFKKQLLAVDSQLNVDF